MIFAQQKQLLLFVLFFIMQLCWLVSRLKHPLLFLQGHSPAPQKQRRRRLKRQILGRSDTNVSLHITACIVRPR